MKIRKRILSGVVATALVATLTVPALATTIPAGSLRDGEATATPTTATADTTGTALIFSDVPSTHWAHSAITNMTSKGLFSGTTTPVNGVGTFSPDKTMSRAEFVVVVVRALYKSELDAMPKSVGQWWDNARQVAIANGLLEDSELDNGNLSKPMTRQEMAMLLARAAEVNKDYPDELLDSSRIPDYSSIGGYYKDYVITAYSMGMLCGTDKSGTFSPQGTLSRAQAATVLYRLVEPSARQDVDFDKVVVPPVTQGQKWVEGETHSKPQVGDIVVKDGKEIVLKETYGILGAMQGVDIYTGTTENGITIKEGMASWYDSRPFSKDQAGVEMHTSPEWQDLYDKLYPDGLYGEYDGEVYNTWFKWNASDNEWNWTGGKFN